jgi:hypothetical protein
VSYLDPDQFPNGMYSNGAHGMGGGEIRRDEYGNIIPEVQDAASAARELASQVQHGQISEERADEAAYLQQAHRESGAPPAMAYTQRMRDEATRAQAADRARAQAQQAATNEQSVAARTQQTVPPARPQQYQQYQYQQYQQYQAPRPAPVQYTMPRREARQSQLAPLQDMFQQQFAPQQQRPVLAIGQLPTWAKILGGLTLAGVAVMFAVKLAKLANRGD